VGKATKKHGSRGPFVQLHRYMMQTAAWRDLSPTARALYVELKARYNGKNNGALAFSARDAGDALGRGKSSASRFFVELEQHGFIVREKASTFNQKRLSIEWRLTELRCDVTNSLPTKEFARWGMDRPKKQKAGPSMGQTGPVAGLPPEGSPARVVTGPLGGPARTTPPTRQSHQWATYTSSPEGGRSATGVARSLSSGAHAAESHNSAEPDPLVRLILEMFPGSTVSRRESVQ
jgi:hypothetical protein